VIDYYSAPPLADGSPVFSLDVRPALDSVSAVKERIAVATEEAWAAFKSEEANAH
jgi:cytochrome c heme-lyase